MYRNFVLLIVAVNLLVVALCGFVSYSDLYLREYGVRNHADTRVIEVEYYFLGYRPTYEYVEIADNQTVVNRGCWTLDFFQLNILVMAVADLLWLLYMRNKKGHRELATLDT